MMEEVSDDTNGESSFEFVSGKIDELVKDESAAVPSGDHFYISPAAPLDASKSLSAGSSVLAPTFPMASQSPASDITFYNIDPKDSKSVMLPPPILSDPSPQVMSPVPDVSHSQYPPVQQSYSTLPLTTSYSTPPLGTSYSTSPLTTSFSTLPSTTSYSTPPPASSYSTQQSPQTFTVPPSTQSYYSPPAEHALSLPLDRSAMEPLQQHHSERGVWGWIRGNDFLHKVAEKAKNSVDSVITTLDPGMKEIINTGGDVNVIVASGNEDKISAVREAFQLVFGKATVQGMAVQSNSIAPQPVGFSAGLKAAEERINNLKQMGFGQDKHVFVAVENFLTELTPENWFDIGCLLLQDQHSGITFQVYTEAIPVSSQFVTMAKDQTQHDYPLGWSGYSVTIGQIMGPALGVHHSMWHQALTGVSRREIIFLAAKTLAGLYRSRLGR